MPTAKPYQRRPLDKLAMRRRQEIIEARQSGQRPRSPAPPPSDLPNQRAKAILPALEQAAPRPPVKDTDWTHEQDLTLIRALAMGCSSAQSVRLVRAHRPQVTRGSCDHRLRVLWQRFGRQRG